MKAGALFLIAKSYMATGKLDEAGRALDSYLATYAGAVDYEEALYQKGRLLFMRDDLEGALRALQAFVAGHPASPFISSAWFWAAESLYGLGRLDDARALYSKIISDYPTSVKIEAARYKIELIQVRGKEVELARLLKWSHEDYLRTVEEYQNRERAYAQAIEYYQKRLAGAASSEDQKTIADLRERLAAAEAAASPSSWLGDQLARLQQTLAAKETALTLKEKALNLIDAGAGAGN
jgi:tetratricopeptide (TPR) repeat protein